MASNAILGSFFGIEYGDAKKEVGTTQISTNSGTTTISNTADVVDNVMPSVVSITNMSVQEVQNFFYGTTQYESESRGSGIIIGQNDSELLIVTNYHVVEGSKTLTVTFIDDANIEAQIKGTDSDRDLAIVAVPLANIDKTTIDSIKVATLGDSDKLRVGETTIAIGNALGYGQSVTSGIVSALGRTLDDYAGELIQTDAAINEGNSGGALLNANGEVIGINSAKLYGETVESMGYAIPISDVIDILNELMNRETKTKVAESERGGLGIIGQTVSDAYMQALNMSAGVLVSEVIEGSGADAAGLPVNSIITGINGTSIDTMEELQEQLEYYKAGETVELTIEVPIRGGYTEETVEVTLSKIDQ
ncbi:MAG: trypsin-like peptidase domain-containing protein [Tyzzerella sp.]|nr:trypsin-like peptidase domain-containing protein [Tyzzerella sp.]